MYPSQTLSDATRATRKSRPHTVSRAAIMELMDARQQRDFQAAKREALAKWETLEAALEIRNACGAVLPAGLYGRVTP